MSIVILHNICLSCNCRSHFLGRNGFWNKIHTNWVNYDFICQSVSTICSKHNIHLWSWWLERWHWENMCLLMQNMELNILSNGGERISKCIMCGCAHYYKTCFFKWFKLINLLVLLMDMSIWTRGVKHICFHQSTWLKRLIWLIHPVKLDNLS